VHDIEGIAELVYYVKSRISQLDTCPGTIASMPAFYWGEGQQLNPTMYIKNVVFVDSARISGPIDSKPSAHER
jgi:hypothetical protein